MAGSTQLPTGAAVAVGLFFALVGSLVMLVGLGVIGTLAGAEAPPWVIVCIGLGLVLAGAAIINGYAIAGGAAQDGDLLPGTPFAVRLVQYMLGLAIATLLALVFSWVAFVPGPRAFSGSGLLGVVGAVSERVSRVAFGVGAVLMWGFVAAFGVIGLRRLRRK